MSVEAVVGWSEFQVLQKSYLFKRKAELSTLFEAFSIKNYDYIHSVVSHYIENARSYELSLIEVQSKKIIEKLKAQNYNQVWGGLNKLDLIINSYIDQY